MRQSYFLAVVERALAASAEEVPSKPRTVKEVKEAPSGRALAGASVQPRCPVGNVE